MGGRASPRGRARPVTVSGAWLAVGRELASLLPLSAPSLRPPALTVRFACLHLGPPTRLPSRAPPRLLLLAVSGVRESDPSLLLCIIVGGGMEEAEVSAEEEAARAGRNADACAWELLLPPWSSQKSAALSAPARTAPATPSSVSTMLSTAGWTSLRSSVTMADLARRIYASCLLPLFPRAADPYLPIDDVVVRPGVPTFVLTATFAEGTPERPT